MFGLISETHHIDLCFVVECSGSMQEYIDTTRESIRQIVAMLAESYSDFSSRLAFVGYTDFPQEPIVFDFTESVSLRSKLQALKKDMGMIR
jgi:hypothetical protein